MMCFWPTQMSSVDMSGEKNPRAVQYVSASTAHILPYIAICPAQEAVSVYKYILLDWSEGFSVCYLQCFDSDVHLKQAGTRQRHMTYEVLFKECGL